MDEGCREVAYAYTRGHVAKLVGKTAAQNEAAAAEQAAFGVEVEVECHRVACAGIMVAAKAVGGDGYEFALASRGAAALCEIVCASRPKNVLFAGHHPHDIGPYILVVNKRNTLREVFVIGYVAEAKTCTHGCCGSLVQQLPEHSPLCAFHPLGFGPGGGSPHCRCQELTRYVGEVEH